MSPPNGTTDSVTPDNSFSALIGSAIYDPINNDFYVATRDRQIFRGDGTGDTDVTRVLNLTASSGRIRDMEIYMVNGVRKLFVSYIDNADTLELAISNLPYDDTTDNETFTATCAGTAIGGNSAGGDIILLASENGLLYIFNENQVHKFDGTAATGGTNGTMTGNVLLFPTGYRIVDAIEFRGSMFIGLHNYTGDTRSENFTFTLTGQPFCGVYVWDRSSVLASNRDFYHIQGAIRIDKIFVNPRGELMALITNTDGMAEVRKFNGSAFDVVQRVGYNAHPVARDGVVNMSQLVAWGGKDGHLYAYGPSIPGDRDALYDLLSITVGTNNSMVLIPAIGTSSAAPALYASYLSSGLSPLLVRWKLFQTTGQSGAGVSTPATANVYFPVNYLPQMSTIKHIDLYTYRGDATGTTSVGTLNIYLNNNSTAWAQKTITKDDIARGYIRIEVNKPFVNSIQLGLSFAGSTALSTSNDLCPAMAVIDYDDTEAKG
jgi:hypothetical protein